VVINHLSTGIADPNPVWSMDVCSYFSLLLCVVIVETWLWADPPFRECNQRFIASELILRVNDYLKQEQILGL
jgi:hypothetical protein